MKTDFGTSIQQRSSGQNAKGQKKNRKRPPLENSRLEDRSITIICYLTIVSCVQATTDYFNGQVISVKPIE